MNLDELRARRAEIIALAEKHLLLIEPRGTPNTGDPTTVAPRQVI